METPPQNESPPKQTNQHRYLVGLLGFLLGFFVFGYILGLESLRRIPQGKSHGQHHQRLCCMTNHRSLHLAAELFAVDKNEQYPSSLDALDTEDYLQKNHFSCPAVRSNNTKNTSTNHDYIYCLCSQPNGFPKPLLFLYELPKNHYQEYVNMTFSDGLVKSLHENMDEFRQQIQAVNNSLFSRRNKKP